MNHPHFIKKYLNIINKTTYVLIAFGFIQGFFIYQNLNKNQQIVYALSSNTEEKDERFSEYNTTSPIDTDFSLALLDIFNAKIKLIFFDIDEKSRTDFLNYIKSNKETILKNSKLTEENHLIYNNFSKIITQPLNQQTINNARNVLKKGEAMYALIDKQDSLSPSFKRIFKDNLNQLSILVKMDTSIEITNVYKANLHNVDFQELLVKDRALLWKTYFEDMFGKDISPIANIQDGSFHKLKVKYESK